MKVNLKKSQAVHVRNKQRPLCKNQLILNNLILNNEPMEYVTNYKYLGCCVNEHASNAKTVEALTVAAGRSFGRIVNMFKHMGNMGY